MLQLFGTLGDVLTRLDNLENLKLSTRLDNLEGKLGEFERRLASYHDEFKKGLALCESKLEKIELDYLHNKEVDKILQNLANESSSPCLNSPNSNSQPIPTPKSNNTLDPIQFSCEWGAEKTRANDKQLQDQGHLNRTEKVKKREQGKITNEVGQLIDNNIIYFVSETVFFTWAAEHSFLQRIVIIPQRKPIFFIKKKDSGRYTVPFSFIQGKKTFTLHAVTSEQETKQIPGGFLIYYQKLFVQCY